jgi:hypothetical protein
MKARAMNDAEVACACERILAENLADVATELRLIDVADLIGYIRGQSSATLEDLVNSAAELYFKHGALRYALCADMELSWELFPSVSLNMEFCWHGVAAFFRLRLDFACAGVDLQHLSFDDGAIGEDPGDYFARAIADARISPPRQAQ